MTKALRRRLPMMLILLSALLLAQAGSAESPRRCVTPPKLLRARPPLYTSEARRAGVEGDVILDVTFTREGRPTAATVVKGLPMGLNDSAAKAIMRWRFAAPVMDAGQTRCSCEVKVPFRLHYGR